MADRTGTGTIKNADPMPKAWLARFGRAASDHVVQAIEGRWRDGALQTQTHFTLGRRQVDHLFGGWDTIVGAFNPAGADTRNAGGSLVDGGPAGGDFAVGGSAGRSPADSRTTGRRAAGTSLMNSLGLPTGDLRDVLMGSSFFYSRLLDEHGERPEPPGWLGQWSAWGQTAATHFSGADGPLSLNGEVATAMLGVDSRWDRWLAGVTLCVQRRRRRLHAPGGRGRRREQPAHEPQPLRALPVQRAHPPLGRARLRRGRIDADAGQRRIGAEPGIGSGSSGIQADLAATMAAFGGRGVLSVRSGRAGAFELAIVSDALVTNTVSEAAQDLMGAAARRAGCG